LETFSSKLHYTKHYIGQLTNKPLFAGISGCLIKWYCRSVAHSLFQKAPSARYPVCQQRAVGTVQWETAFSLSWFLDGCLTCQKWSAGLP